MIFNKDNTGSVEMKDLIGFIYKSINFDNLKSYIGFAENDIKKIIGKDVFKTAQDHYSSANYKAAASQEHPEYVILDNLVRKIQFPVSVNAYRRYAPSLDLSHSDKGRQIFVSETEKPAFEWQIEKDNENLANLANEGVDLLLEFLDENIDTTFKDEDEEDQILIPWGTSKEYEATKELLISKPSEFDMVFLIGSRRRFLALVPFIRYVQDNMIRSAFMPAKFTEIIDQIKDNDLTEENKLVVAIAQQPLALLALSMAIRRLSVEVLPNGLFTPFITSVIKSKAITTKIDRNEVSGYLEKDGALQFKKLQEYLRKLDLVKAGQAYLVDDPTQRMDPDKKFIRL